VRSGRGDQGGRERDACGGVDGWWSGGRQPVHQLLEATRHQRRGPCGEEQREHLISEQEQPPRRHDGCDEQDERPQEQQVAADLPEPPEEAGEVVDELGEALVGRGRIRRGDRDQPEGRRGEEEQDQVRGASDPRCIRA
jgi:hypothetical protein